MLKRRDLYLFLAPPTDARLEMERALASYGVDAKAMPSSRLHMTVAKLGSFDAPRDAIDWVSARLARMPLDSCRICFDRMVQAPGRVLLQPSRPLPGFDALQVRLAERMGEKPALWRRMFRPHVTLGYGNAAGPTLEIDPISWTADRLLLVESLYGEGVHIVHDSWPLARIEAMAA